MEHAATLSFEGLPIVPWLTAAVSAPSAHNSQPWVFRPFEDGIGLGWDQDTRNCPMEILAPHT